MSTTTTNYGLVKPSLSDSADITAMNKNWDTIDAKLKSALQGVLEKALAINKGGTGATTAADARKNLGAMGASDIERVKTLNLDVSSGDYVSFVIPLIAIDSDSDNNYATGDFFFKRVNTAGARMTRISVSCGKKHGETTPYYTLSFDEVPQGNGVKIHPRTFTYNGEKWFGLYFEILSAAFNGSRYFVGRANRFDDIKIVSVYNSNTREVLNEEIYTSLADEGTSLSRVFVGTPKVMIDDKMYEIHHEGNASRTLLWENSEVLNEFPEQTITLSNNDYVGIEIIYLVEYLKVTYKSTGFLPYEPNDLTRTTVYSMDCITGISTEHKPHLHKRVFSVQHDGSLHFEAGMAGAIDGDKFEATNYACIPWRIYGIK